MGVLRSLDSTRGYTLNCDEPPSQGVFQVPALSKLIVPGT